MAPDSVYLGADDVIPNKVVQLKFQEALARANANSSRSLYENPHDVIEPVPTAAVLECADALLDCTDKSVDVAQGGVFGVLAEPGRNADTKIRDREHPPARGDVVRGERGLTRLRMLLSVADHLAESPPKHARVFEWEPAVREGLAEALEKFGV
jgi:hypothetical protein